MIIVQKLKKFILVLLFPMILLGEQHIFKIPDNIIGYNRTQVYDKLKKKPNISNNLIDAYDTGYIIFYDKNNFVDGVMISTKKNKNLLSLKGITLGDSLQKVRELYGKELELHSSLMGSYEATWKIDDKWLIVGLLKDKKTKKSTITSVTYCKQNSFGIISFFLDKTT